MKKILAICLLAVLAFAYFSKAPEPVALSIISYNYTGRYVHTFSVNGQWGGHSSEEDGGGIVCCLSFKPTSKLPFTVEVEWTFGREEDEKGNITRPQEPHKATVTVNGPLPKGELSNFEVHFMPDGSVQAYITDFKSSPFLLPNGKPNPNIRIVPPGDTVLPPR